MSLLTIDVGGGNETVLRFSRAGHAEPKTIGARRYAFAGNERSMIRQESHVIPLVGANDLTAAEVLTLRSIFALGVAVVCQGDVFNNGNVPIYCVGELTDEMEVGGTRWIPTLTLRQVNGTARGSLRGGVAPSGVGTAQVTILGKRRGTVAVSGVASVTITPLAKRRATVSASGRATTAVVLRKKASASAAGRGSTTVTGSKIP